MFLTRLNVHGFKSFAHPVTIEFHPGLNVVVGPNGSGKSNIIDALRWVLGDNFREMRVSQGKEVIFHGSAGSKPLGMAFIETGWSDTKNLSYTIGRRIFASGESEYFLNQNRLRLKDLKGELRKRGFLVDSVGVTVVDNTKLQTLFDFRPSEKLTLLEMASGTYSIKEKLSLIQTSLHRIAEKICRLKERDIELNLQIEKISEHARQEECYLSEEKLLVALRKEYLNQLILQRNKKIDEAICEKENAEKKRTQFDAEIIRYKDMVVQNQELLYQKEQLQSQHSERIQALLDEIHSLDQQVYFHLTEARQREGAKLFHRRALEDSRKMLINAKKNLKDLQVKPLYQETLSELGKKEDRLNKEVSEIRRRKELLDEQISYLKQEWSRYDTSIQFLTEEFNSLLQEQKDMNQSLGNLTHQIKENENHLKSLCEEQSSFLEKRKKHEKKVLRKKSLLKTIQNTLREYEQGGKIDFQIAELLKELVHAGWPGKVVYALNWLFKDLSIGLNIGKNQNWRSMPDQLGRCFVCRESLPPNRSWQIFPAEQIINVFRQSIIPRVNMISPDGSVVYRRDGVLIFPRKLVTSQSGVRFYQSWEKKANNLQKNIQKNEKELLAMIEQEKKLEKQTAKKKGDLRVLKLRYEDFTGEREKIIDKIKNVDLKNRTINEEKKSVEDEIHRLEWERENLGCELDQEEERFKEVQKKRVDREKLSLLEEKLREELTRLKKQMNEGETILETIDENRVRSQATWLKLTDKFKKINESIQFESKQKEAIADSLLKIREDKARNESQKDKLQMERDALSHQIERIILQIEKYRFEIQELTSRFTEIQEWNTDDVEMPPFSSQSQLGQMIKEKEKLLKSWEVRRGSIAQLQELVDRQNYLKEKMESFQETFTRCDKTRIECEHLCLELFEEFLSEVNFFFQKNFKTVFNGGRAKIEIEDSSLNIIIQIPGKKKQKLSLLSSGEKALSALCLFFALFKSGGYRFCFFDEVDASLDHFNSLRLAKLIKEFSQECQVIIVTHQEEIMEVSDRIIGVTMDEPGISRVIPFLGKDLALLSSSSR